MSDLKITLVPPVRYGVNGPYWAGEFEVRRQGEEPKQVEVKLVPGADGAFERQMRAVGREYDEVTRSRIVENWGKEKVTEWLNEWGQLPPAFTLGDGPRPGDSTYHMVNDLEAQQRLKRWGML